MRIRIAACAFLLLTLTVGSSSLWAQVTRLPSEPAQAAHRLPSPDKPETEPIECAVNGIVELRNRYIRTSGHGILVPDNCTVEIFDSHIVADGVGILVSGNGTLEVTNSFVQGAQVGLTLTDNATVSNRGSTFRGGNRAVSASGNTVLDNLGGNSFERIDAWPALVPRGEPLECVGDEKIEVVGRYIETDGDAVTVAGRCEVLVSDSHLVAGGAAIRVVGEGKVRLRNSTIEGEEGAVVLADTGYLHAAGSNFEGPIYFATGYPRFADGGGNSIAGRGPSQVKHEPIRPRIWIGPGGVGLSVSEAAGGQVDRPGITIDPTGIYIVGRRTVVEKPIEDCADLCAVWPDLYEEDWGCAALVLGLRGYPVGETDACIGVETRLQCGICAQALRTRNGDCRAVAKRCLRG